MRVSLLGCILLVLSASAPAQDTGELEKRVTDFTLANGLRFVIMERHQAPVISFQTHVGGGSVNDPAGQTGLSYLVSRLAYKGTESVGSRNWAEEKKALDAMDEAYERMEAERNKGLRMKPELYDTLRSQWRLAVDAAQRLGDSAEFNKILSENGVTGAHATGNSTSLQAGYTLPSNRLELWFAMESQRLIHPVLREFDLERNNLMEEQAKSRSAVHARVLEALLAAAFTAHPYRVPTGGWSSDLAELKRSEARDFVEKHFVPGNIVIGIAGDVDPAEARRLADKYFGPMPARPMPPVLHTAEPPQNGPRLVELAIPSQSITAIGYKRPNYLDKDDVTLDVIQTILGDNNGGLAFRELIQEKKVATAVQVAATYPDGQYPCLFTFVAAPAAGQSMERPRRASTIWWPVSAARRSGTRFSARQRHRPRRALTSAWPPPPHWRRCWRYTLRRTATGRDSSR